MFRKGGEIPKYKKAASERLKQECRGIRAEEVGLPGYVWAYDVIGCLAPVGQSFWALMSCSHYLESLFNNYVNQTLRRQEDCCGFEVSLGCMRACLNM